MGLLYKLLNMPKVHVVVLSACLPGNDLDNKEQSVPNTITLFASICEVIKYLDRLQMTFKVTVV